jgi:hypothetical protein
MRDRMKIQTMGNLIGEMRAVARNVVPAPADAATPSAESAEAVIRLLTAENRDLLRTIRDAKPQSVAQNRTCCGPSASSKPLDWSNAAVSRPFLSGNCMSRSTPTSWPTRSKRA